MENLQKALEALFTAWRDWGDTNYNVRDDTFAEFILRVSNAESVYAALKDAGILKS